MDRRAVFRIGVFVAFIIGLGFLQFWVIEAETFMDEINWNPKVDWADVFADGSLFFIAATLLGGAAYSIVTGWNHFKNRPGIVLATFCLLLCCTFFIAIAYGLEENKALAGVNHVLNHKRYLWAQLVMVAAAIPLALIVDLLYWLADRELEPRKDAPTASFHLDLQQSAGYPVQRHQHFPD